jgi:hypothetical protein
LTQEKKVKLKYALIALSLVLASPAPAVNEIAHLAAEMGTSSADVFDAMSQLHDAGMDAGEAGLFVFDLSARPRARSSARAV